MPRRSDAKPKLTGRADEFGQLTLTACLTGRDAAFNAHDLIESGSGDALLALRDCERELDRLERQIDERLPAAITQVSEHDARELLACLRFVTDLERIADILWRVGRTARTVGPRLPRADRAALVRMAAAVHRNLALVCECFEKRDPAYLPKILHADAEIDRICRSIFHRHVAGEATHESIEIVLMARGLERAGDHVSYLGEELYQLIEGRTIRHAKLRTPRD